MMEELNSTRDKKPPVFEDLVTKASRFGAAGWLAFLVILCVLIIQNLFYALKPKEVLGVENGIVVGQVTFNETRYRTQDDVLADTKIWATRCVSMNKITIYEDLSTCLMHMDHQLANAKVKAYEELNYATTIEAYGCEKTTTEFDMQRTVLTKKDDVIHADLYGDVICSIPGEKPKSQSFAARIEGQLIPKTTNTPLGLKITSYGDIE